MISLDQKEFDNKLQQTAFTIIWEHRDVILLSGQSSNSLESNFH